MQNGHFEKHVKLWLLYGNCDHLWFGYDLNSYNLDIIDIIQIISFDLREVQRGFAVMNSNTVTE